MQGLLRKAGTSELLVPLAAGAGLSCASLTNFLAHNDYPYFRSEVAILVAALLATSIGMAFFYRAQRQWGRSLLEGLLIALFVDLNSDSLLLAGLAGLGVLAITWWKRWSLLGPMAVMGIVILVTTALGVGGRPSWMRESVGRDFVQPSAQSADKPMILHLILDEHIGIEGLPEADPEAARLRRELSAFYLDAGFRSYGGAYSQHSATVNAIPHILNYGTRLGAKAYRDGVEVGPTDYLTDLAKSGFRLTILQSDFADLCSGSSFHRCITYDSSSLRPTLAVPMSATDRASLIALKMHNLSDIFRWGTIFWDAGAIALGRDDRSVAMFDWDLQRSSTIGALAAMDDLTRRLKSARPGEVYFAHLLLPHFPYAVRPDCSYLPWRSWDSRRSNAELGVLKHAYYDQIRCTTRKLDAVLAAVAGSPARGNNIVILHADHGSKLSEFDSLTRDERVSQDLELVARFSALFAIRGPGIQPSYTAERHPVAFLLRDFANSGFRTAPAPKRLEEHIVYFSDRNWNPRRRVSLPQSWTAPRPDVVRKP